MALRVSGVALCVLAGILTAAQASARPLRPVERSMDARALCDNLVQVQLRKAARERPIADHARFHQALRKATTVVPAGAGTAIRVGIGGGMGASGQAGAESVVAWRAADGRWHASRYQEADNGEPAPPQFPAAPRWPDPSPLPAAAGHLEAPSNLAISEGPLPPADSAQLDRALGASCLALEPPRLPASLPLSDGTVEHCLPDSASWLVEIRLAGQVRAFERPCRLVGPVGLIARTLDEAALYPKARVRGRADLYAIDDNPTAASLRAFLTARLPGVSYRDAAGTGVITRIDHASPCTATLSVEQAGGGTRMVTLDWQTPNRFAQWIDDGVVFLGTDKSSPVWIASGSALALQLQGVLWHLPRLCDAQP